MFLEATLPHLDTVFSIARRSTRDWQHAEDLVQETYLRAFAHFDTHDRNRTRSWLVAICVNAARSEFRRLQARPVEDLTADPVMFDMSDVAELAVQTSDHDAIVRSLAAIPEEQRLAIVLMDIGGLTAHEAADVVGCPRGTILARVHRGRRRLAVLLDRDGIRP